MADTAERASGTGPKLAALALGIVPVASALAVLASPRVTMASPLADVVAVAVAVLPALLALVFAARARLDVRPQLGIAVASALGLAVIGVVGLVPAWVPVQATCLVALGFGVGGIIGSRVEHPGHVLPAAFVASAADLASVLSPEGPSNAALSSDKALSVLALGAPIPGSEAFTFVLGVGDLLFIGLVLRVGVEFGVPAARVGAAMLGGLVIAFTASALLGRAVPALVPLGLVTVASIRAFRRVRKRDRRVTQVACAAAVAVALGVLARSLLPAPAEPVHAPSRPSD